MTDDFVLTACPFCGCGCSFYLVVADGKAVDVAPCFTDRISQGRLCIKGRQAWGFIHNDSRLKRPLVRKADSLKQTTWEVALDLVARSLNEIRQSYGADSIGLLSSAKCTNEENYLMQKFARAVIGTNNVDHCARLCHASTVVGLVAAFGSGAMTNSIPEVADADCILITGSNTTEQHPLIGTRILEAKSRGATIIVVDPRETPLSAQAKYFLRQKPGTDVAWLNGFMNVIINEGLADEQFIKDRTEGFEELKKTAANYPPEKVQQITGINAQLLRKAAQAYAGAGSAMILYSMGITQHTTGTNNVKSVANLAMLTGNVGKAASGVNPLRGQNNVQGACDLGALPNVYSGYQSVADAAMRAKFEKAWGKVLPEGPGLTVVEMMNAAEAGELKALFIMGENPMLSDPDINHVRKALKKLKFLLVQDIFLTETAELADVVLPGACFAEKEGTFTNTDRTVIRVRKATEPPGEALADWQILCSLAARLDGEGFSYQSASEIMTEIASVTPSYGGINFERLDAGEVLAWPCPDEKSGGTQFLHKDRFARGRGRFHAVDYIPTAEETDEQYPFILTTGRTTFHYHTGSMTRRIKLLHYEVPTGYMEMNPADASRLQIEDGEKVTVKSRRGHIEIAAKVTGQVPEGTVFIPFHFAECAANMLTNPVLDPDAKIPVLKVCAVKVEKKN